MKENRINFRVSHILTDPERQWTQFRNASAGKVRTAFRDLDVDWKKYNTKDYLFTHDTACCSVATEHNGYWITPPCWELVNANGNAWTTPVLLASFKTFIGGENYLEHVQIPALSKGKILDAVARPVVHHSEKYGDANIYYIDVLVATNRKHTSLIERIESGKLNTLSMGCGKADCQITMSDGTERPIIDVKEGDMVLTHTGNIKPVTRTFEFDVVDTPLYHVEYDGGALELTGEHPVYVERGGKPAEFIPISELVTGDVMQHPIENGEVKRHRVAIVEKSLFTGKVYNLSVADDNSYVADGISVHNCLAEVTQCSICGKKIYDGDKNCEHLDRHIGQMVTCSDGKDRICAELCFPEKTRIVMKDGTRKNIENIQIGEEVITHHGNVKPVTKTFVRDYIGELIGLHIQGLPEVIRSTPNHPYLVIEQHYKCACGCEEKINSPERPTNKRNYSIKYAMKHRPENYVEHAELIWKEAKDIVPYDIVVSPRFNGSNIPENVELAYLLGWFVAEGNYLKINDKRTGIRLTLNYNDELNKAYELVSLLNKHFASQTHNGKEVLAYVNTYERKDGGYKLIINFNNIECANWMYERCGEYAGNKTLSDEVMNWDNEALSAFLLAYWEGDGTVDKFGRYKVSTISENLASQIQLIATKLNIWNCRQIVFDQKTISISTALKSERDSMNFRPRYEISMYGHNTADTLFNCEIDRNKTEKWRFENNYALYKVISKESEKFNGKVYNIEVNDDHSYLVEGIAVHNCGSVDEHGDYIENSNVFIEISFVDHPAFPGSVVNSFVETEDEREIRENSKSDLEKLFSENLFERLRVADRDTSIALKITRDMTKADRIAEKIVKKLDE